MSSLRARRGNQRKNAVKRYRPLAKSDRFPLTRSETPRELPNQDNDQDRRHDNDLADHLVSLMTLDLIKHSLKVIRHEINISSTNTVNAGYVCSLMGYIHAASRNNGLIFGDMDWFNRQSNIANLASHLYHHKAITYQEASSVRTELMKYAEHEFGDYNWSFLRYGKANSKVKFLDSQLRMNMSSSNAGIDNPIIPRVAYQALTRIDIDAITVDHMVSLGAMLNQINYQIGLYRRLLTHSDYGNSVNVYHDIMMDDLRLTRLVEQGHLGMGEALTLSNYSVLIEKDSNALRKIRNSKQYVAVLSKRRSYDSDYLGSDFAHAKMEPSLVSRSYQEIKGNHLRGTALSLTADYIAQNEGREELRESWIDFSTLFELVENGNGEASEGGSIDYIPKSIVYTLVESDFESMEPRERSFADTMMRTLRSSHYSVSFSDFLNVPWVESHS